jgi:outer membrane protein
MGRCIRKLMPGLSMNIIALVVPCSAVQVSAENLVDALVNVYQNDPTLNAERARQRASDESVVQALSGWRPTVSATGTISESWSDTSQSTKTSLTSTNLSIELSQPIFRGFRTLNNTNSAEADVAAGKQELLAVEQDVILHAVQAYMNVLRDREILRLRQTGLKAFKRQSQDVAMRFKVGDVTKTDVAQTHARLAGALADVTSAKAALAASIANYEKTVGHPPQNLVYPSAFKLPWSLDVSQTMAQSFNPNILSAFYIQNSAVYKTEMAKGNLWPEIRLSASAAKAFNPQHGVDSSTNYRVEGILSFPLYDGGRSYSKIREAKQLESQRSLDTIMQTRTVREGVANAWFRLIAAQETLTAVMALVNANELALNGVRKEYDAGTRSTLDALNAENELITSKIKFVSAKHDATVSSFMLLHAIGVLTARDIHLPVKVYDADKNYLAVRGKWFGTGANLKND